MRYHLLFQVSSTILALLVLSLDIQANEANEPNLTLTIHCPKDEIKQGDEIPIVFTITNKGKSSYSYDICDYDRGIGVCAQRYLLVAKRQDGTIVPDPRGEFRPYFGGEYSRYSGLPRGQIEPDESFRKTIALNQWALVNEPGRYTITGTYYVEGKHPSAEQIVINSDSIEIIVKPRTNKAMGDYIRELSDKLQALKKPLSKEGMQESKDILKRLAYTCDPRIVPTLIDWLYEVPWSFWVEEAFVHYLPRDPKIKNAILEAAKKRGSIRSIRYLLEKLGCSRDEFREIMDLSLTIHCPEDEIKQGDEIPIVFTITNNGESPYSYDKRNYDRSGRMREYELVAKREDGTTVLDPREREPRTCRIGGGLSSGTGQIKLGESFSKTIALNLWALINEPGGYTVTGTYYPSMYPPAMEQMRADSEPIGITVKPRTDKEMADYIRELSNELQKSRIPKNGWTYNSLSEMRRQREEVIKRLMYTCDRRIVPTLIDLMYENHHKNDAFWAKEGFVCYLPREPKIKEAVLEAAKKRGLAGCMQTVLEAFGCSKEEFKEVIRISLASDNLDILGEGVGAAQEHPDDEHTQQLIAIATDANRPDPNRPFYAIERHRAIYAIAFNRTDEGVMALKGLLKDPNEDIRRTTKEAIRRAYKRHPVYPKYSDDEYTAKLVLIATDLKDPRQISFIYEIARTRTEEGVKAIKTLLEDPDKNIPIAESDEGVKTIRNLLRDPDKDVRDMTSGIVRQTYRTYPGRPLKREDFPELFREIIEEREARKKRVLEGVRNK